MQMKNQELLNFVDGVTSLQWACDKKFSYAAMMNSRKLKGAYIALAEALRPVPGFLEYQQAIKTTVEQAGKDQLTEKYKDTILKQQDKDAEDEKLLEEETEVDIYKVTFKLFPDLSPQQVEYLCPMVRETEVEMEEFLNE